MIASTTIQGIYTASEIVLSYLNEQPPKGDEMCPIRDFHPIEERVYHVFASHILIERPVLFLDIDGVINSDSDEECRIRDNETPKVQANLFPGVRCFDYHSKRIASEFFKKEAVAELDKLLMSFPEMVIVLSSDWRKKQSLLAIRSIFETYHFSTRIIDKTVKHLPEIDLDLLCMEEEACIDHEIRYNFRYRGALIRHYLKEHPLITNYVILDDCNQGTVFSDRFIYVDPRTLLTKKHIQLASSTLKKKRIEPKKTPLTTTLPSIKEKKIKETIERYPEFDSEDAAKFLFSLAKYEDPKVMELALGICDKLKPYQKAFLALELTNKRETIKFLTLISVSELGPIIMSKIFLKLLENEDSRPFIETLIRMTTIPRNQTHEMIQILQKKDPSHFILKYLLQTKNIDSFVKDSTLLNLIGIDGITYLALRKEDMNSSIRTLTANKFSNKAIMMEILPLLLDNGDLTLRAKGMVFEELSKQENSNDQLTFLLGQELDPYFIGQAFMHLTTKSSKDEITKTILLKKVVIPPYPKGTGLIQLSKREGTNELIKLLIHGGERIPKDSRDEALSYLVCREGTEEIMLLLLDNEEISLFTKADCLKKIAAKQTEGTNELLEKKIIFSLMKVEEERGLLLEAFTKKLIGSGKALEILKLLLGETIFDENEKEERKNEVKPPEKKICSIQNYVISDRNKGEALVQLAVQRAFITDNQEIFWIEQMMKLLLSKDISYDFRGRSFAIISSGEKAEQMMEFMVKKYNIHSEYMDLAAYHLADKVEYEDKLQRFLITYGNEISIYRKKTILKDLLKRTSTSPVVDLLFEGYKDDD